MSPSLRALALASCLPALASGPTATSFRVHEVALGSPAVSMLVGQLDADAAPDLVLFLRDTSNSLRFVAAEGQGNGRLTPVDVQAFVQLGYLDDPILAADDLDGDSFPELAFTSIPSAGVFDGDGDLIYTPSSVLPTFGGNEYGVDFTDVDGDGDLDSGVLVEDGGMFVDIGLNDGSGQLAESGGFFAPTPFSVDCQLQFADLDANGVDSTLVASELGLFLTHYPDGPNDSVTLFSGEVAEFAAADVDGSGRIDLVLCDRLAGGMQILLDDGAGSFQPASFVATGAGPESLVAEDLNGDGWFDLAVCNRGDDDVALLFGDGLGGFALADRIAVGDGPDQIEAADLDLDGRVDLLVTNGASASLSVLINAL